MKKQYKGKRDHHHKGGADEPTDQIDRPKNKLPSNWDRYDDIDDLPPDLDVDTNSDAAFTELLANSYDISKNFKSVKETKIEPVKRDTNDLLKFDLKKLDNSLRCVNLVELYDPEQKQYYFNQEILSNFDNKSKDELENFARIYDKKTFLNKKSANSVPISSQIRTESSMSDIPNLGDKNIARQLSEVKKDKPSESIVLKSIAKDEQIDDWLDDLLN